jgi:hypothetical protein
MAKHAAQFVSFARDARVLGDEVSASGLSGLANMRGVSGMFSTLCVALQNRRNKLTRLLLSTPAQMKMRGRIAS